MATLVFYIGILIIFVVLTQVSGKGKSAKFAINDPAVGKRTLTNEEFSQHFTGICLELTPANKF